MRIPEEAVLQQVYGETTESRARFESLAGHFTELFGKEEMEFSLLRAVPRSSAITRITMAERSSQRASAWIRSEPLLRMAPISLRS